MEKILKQKLKFFQSLARRYCDNRQTYIVSMFNEETKHLLQLGIDLDPVDGIVWARDGGGRDFDNLSNEAVTPGTIAALGGYVEKITDTPNPGRE